MGFFRQYASQHDIPSNFIYVQGRWLSGFVFKVTSTRFELKEGFSSLDIRICPESLVERVRTTVLPLTFQPFHIRGSERQVDNLLAVLRDIAADPRQCSSGWLGHFSLKQMDLLENIFEPYGQVPWNELIKPLWTDLLSHVDEAWLALGTGFMRPDEERSRSLAYLVPRNPHLRWIASTLPRMNRTSLRRHCLRLLLLLAFPAPGR